jgi:signal transduction histidine kinase
MIKWIRAHLDKLSHRFMLYLTFAIVMIMGINFSFNINHQQQQSLLELREKANIIGLQFQAMRAFIAQKQHAINYDSQGNFEFKHLNPAAVGKGAGDIFGEWTDYSIKQTRLQVRNVENYPDEFERKMMEKLQEDRTLPEIWAEEEIDGGKYFRYLMPLTMEVWCLDCHGDPSGEIDVAGYPKEGYQLGDFGGAISISMPMDMYYADLYATAWRYLVMTTLLILFTLFTTFGVMTVMVADPLSHLGSLTRAMGQGNLDVNLGHFRAHGEIKRLADDFDVMAKKLKEMYNELEKKVAYRTRQLVATNEQLRDQQGELSRMNEELIRANKLQTEFLANMSHELRTPLTAIIAFAELLHDQAEEEGQAEQAENLQDIMECSYQLLTMINDLLDMAKIEAGQMVVKTGAMELAEVAAGVERTILPLARGKNIAVANLISWELPLVWADPDRLRQILLNLVGNAVKFTQPGGKITLQGEVTGEEITCAVIDTGIGISDAEQEYIFDRFRQVDSSSTRSHAGTGLGLALVKNLVEIHQGRIWLKSTLGEGSAFSFTLKIAGEPGDDESFGYPSQEIG